MREYLVINLWDSDKRIREAAVDALGSIGDRRAFDHLVKMLMIWIMTRGSPVIAHGDLRDMREVESLSQTCHDTNCYVRMIAEETLVKFRLKNRKFFPNLGAIPPKRLCKASFSSMATLASVP